MLCKIADLIVEVPATGGMAPRCREYLCESNIAPDIIIEASKYSPGRYSDKMDENGVAYMESAYQFCWKLLKFNGMYLHASAIELNGKAYLFSGNSGIGKSTHSRIWQQTFGAAAQVFNDDKPALRKLEDHWYAYGTPWCGKDGINQNKKVPLAGICFLKQGKYNHMQLLSKENAISKIVAQTVHRFAKLENLELLLSHLEQLVQDIPIFELENRPEPEAAQLSYETMLRAAQERNL